MGKKHEYHGVRVPVLVESYEHVPSPDERVTPFGTEHDYTVDEALADRCFEILMCALAEPHAPKGCVQCIMVYFAIISLGPSTLSNAQIVRYNHHDFLDICMRFLTIPRAAKQHDAADSLIQTCTCLNDDSPLIDALLKTYYHEVPGQRLQARKLASAALQGSKGKRGKKKKTYARGSGDLDMSDEGELEYEEAYLRGEIGNFLDILHEYRSHLFEWRNSLGDVLRKVSDYVHFAMQPFHDRLDLHKFKDIGKRRMWPARAEQLLPFGSRDTIAGLGWTALRALSWTSAGIAAVIHDVVKGPTTIAVLDSYFPGVFVLLGAVGIAELREMLSPSTSTQDVVLKSVDVLVVFSHLSLLAATLLDMSAPNLRLLNARSLELTGGRVDLHHMSNVWVATLDLFVGFDRSPLYPTLGEIRKRNLHYFSRLCAAIHHALGFASSEPLDSALEPEWLLHERRGDMQQAADLRRSAAIDALFSSTQKLDIVYEVQMLASCWATPAKSLVGTAFFLFYKLSERSYWAVSSASGTYCTMSRALSADRFKRCAACWHVRYCSRECQKAAWREEHKEICAVVRRVSDILRVPHELDPTESSAVHDLMEAIAADNWTPALIADLEKLASHFEPILNSVA